MSIHLLSAARRFVTHLSLAAAMFGGLAGCATDEELYGDLDPAAVEQLESTEVDDAVDDAPVGETQHALTCADPDYCVDYCDDLGQSFNGNCTTDGDCVCRTYGPGAGGGGMAEFCGFMLNGRWVCLRL